MALRGREILLILISIILLAFVDIVVVGAMIHPLCRDYGIPWTTFLIDIGPFQNLFIWYVAFTPLVVSLFILLGVAARSWRLGIAGIVFFAGGSEDLAYFFLQGQSLPAELPWLDMTPIVWTRWIFGEPHVTGIGLCISAVINTVLAGLVLFYSRKKSKPEPATD